MRRVGGADDAMSPAIIEKARDREVVKHEVASKIRVLLDEARETYGADEWDEQDVEAAVLELVTEDDP